MRIGNLRGNGRVLAFLTHVSEPVHVDFVFNL